MWMESVRDLRIADTTTHAAIVRSPSDADTPMIPAIARARAAEGVRRCPSLPVLRFLTSDLQDAASMTPVDKYWAKVCAEEPNPSGVSFILEQLRQC
jgi:hypothetical protein